jgi:hypothetical protein
MQFEALAEAGFDLNKTWVKISKSGKGKETRYLVMPVANGALNETDLKTINSLKTLDLLPKKEKVEVNENVGFDEQTESDIPF